MAEEPTDRVSRMSREVRATLAEHGGRFEKLDRRFEEIDRRSHEKLETVCTATGFAPHAHVRSEATDKRMDTFGRRLAKLEEKA